MKQNILIYYAVFFAGMLLLLFSCKKEKEEILTYRNLSFNPSFLSERIPSGLKTSSNLHARLVYDDIADMLDWSEFSDQLILPEDAVKLNSDNSRLKYQWNKNTGSSLLTINLVFSKEGSDFRWDEKIQYGTGMANEYLSIKESSDKKDGSLDYNVYWFCGWEQLTSSCEAVMKHYTWTFKDDGGIFYSLTGAEPSSDAGQPIEFRLNLNPDGTGNSMAVAGTFYYTAAWDSLGNGTYTLHDNENTEIYEWTVVE